MKYWLTYRWHRWRLRRLEWAMWNHHEIIRRSYPEMEKYVIPLKGGGTMTFKGGTDG